MAESLSRRKYADLVKFFKATMNDPKATMKMKYMAASRLDDIYARNEARMDRIAERKLRAQELAERQDGRLKASKSVSTVDGAVDGEDLRAAIERALKPSSPSLLELAMRDEPDDEELDEEESDEAEDEA